MTKSDTTGLPLHRMVTDLWRTLRRDLFGGYRPERHYMRGPGPAWRAKHARVADAGVPDGLHIAI